MIVCATCSAPIEQQRSTRRYCSDACRQKAHRERWKPRSHQRRIALAESAANPRERIASLDGCAVRASSPREVRDLIVRYEWMGTIGHAVAAYALVAPDGELLGAALFGRVGGSRAASSICGPEHAHLAICLERGACVPWAPRNAASFLIRRAVKLAARDHGWRIFFAYADPAAGEVGEIYRTLSWHYLGQGVGDERRRHHWRIFDPQGVELHTRALHQRGWKLDDVKRWPGWRVVPTPKKHKFAWIEGDRRERARLTAALPATPRP